jgi:uncharacterized protein YcfJ
MTIPLKTAFGIAALAVTTTAAAQVTFYSREGFHGQQFSTDRTIHNMDRIGFNDAASSVRVEGGSWQVCEDAGFNGHCVILRPGQYPTLADMGLQNEISSVRQVEDRYGYNDNRDDRGYRADRGRYVAQDYGRRGDERVYEVPVTSVRAIVGPPEQRCWVERREFSGDPNVPGAIAGAVIGGVLGHQIGSGRGRDLGTAGGAVAGAAIGANVGRDEGDVRDVQHCRNVARYDHPDFWDVTYEFRGQEHHVQMTSPPGSSITVSENGEPRM